MGDAWPGLPKACEWLPRDTGTRTGTYRRVPEARARTIVAAASAR
jgi:hypothetical protein